MVQIEYATLVEIEVEASTREEAYKKAHNIASDETNDEVNEQIIGGLTENRHIVNEIK